MDKKSTLHRANKLFKNGQTQKALDEILVLLRGYREDYPYLYDQAIQLKAKYLRANRKASVGLMNSSDADLQIAEVNGELEVFLGTVKSLIQPKRLPSMRSTLLGIGFLTLAVSILLLLINYNFWDQPSFDCRTFKKSNAYKILLLTPKEDVHWGNSLSDNLNQLIADYSFAFPIEVVVKAEEVSDSTDTFEALCADCGIQEVASFNQLYFSDLPTNLHLISPGEGEALSKISFSKALPKWYDTDQLTPSNYAHLLIGLIAHRYKQYELAVASLKSIYLEEGTSEPLFLLKELALADAYLNKGNWNSAIAVYDSILKVVPNHFFAKMNRAVLKSKKNYHVAALTELSELLEEDSTNVVVRYSRAKVLAALNLLHTADAEFEFADSMALRTESETMKTYRQDLILTASIRTEKEILETVKQINLTKEKLRTKRDSLNWWNNQLLEFYLKTGKEAEAKQQLKKINRLMPSTKSYIHIRSNALKVLRDSSYVFWQNIVV